MKRLALLAVAALALAITGCTSNQPAPPPPATVAVAATPTSTAECATMRRDHTAWAAAQHVSPLGGQITDLGNLRGDRLADAGRTYLEKVQSYPGDDALALAADVAEHNFLIAVANGTAQADGVFNDAEVLQAETAAQAVKTTFTELQRTTCPS